MTNPRPHEPGPDHLPSVDETIHQAREGSWQLPPGEPGPVHEDPSVVSARQPGSGAGHSPAHPAPAPGASHAPARAANASHPPAPATAASHGPTGASASASSPVPAAAAAHASGSASGAHPASSGHGAAPAHGAAAAHGSGHDDDHGEEPLGPVDVEMWGAGIVATAIGLFMAVCFVLATSGVGAY